MTSLLQLLDNDVLCCLEVLGREERVLISGLDIVKRFRYLIAAALIILLGTISHHKLRLTRQVRVAGL